MNIAKLGMLVLILLLKINYASAAYVTIAPSSKIVTQGQIYNLNIIIDPKGTAIGGAQLSITFNKSILNVNSITEGNLFKQSGASTFFNNGTINNSVGKVTNIYSAIASNANVSTPGTFITINATVVGSSGMSNINLSNMKISDPNGTYVAANLTNGSVTLNTSALTPSQKYIGLWHLDGGTGNTINDSSGNGNNGKIYGATWIPGKLGYALQLDGTDDYINIPNSTSLNPSNEITIEAWFKPASIPQAGWNKIIAKPYTSYTSPWQQYALTLYNDKLVFELNAGGAKDEVISSVSLANNTWYHVAGTYNGSEMRIYVNGQLNGTLPKSGAIASYPTDVHIGAGIYSDKSTEYVNGTIDEVKILPRALSAGEVKTDYDSDMQNATLDPTPTPTPTSTPLPLITPTSTPIATPTPDTIPPASISNLKNNTYGQTYISWSWIDPIDTDFSKVMIYLNGILKTNVTKGTQFYNATSLTPNTSYTISTHTVDTSGNINKTWMNYTAKTAPTPIPVLNTIFFDNFESNSSNWVPSGLWHITTRRSYSPTHSWWYGQESTGNYNTGHRNSGYLTSPAIGLIGSKSPKLSFMSWYKTEGNTYFDIKVIKISTNGGGTWTTLKQISDTPSQWNLEQIDLSKYTGKTIKIRFYFDTIDSLHNNFEGWYIDDVKIE